MHMSVPSILLGLGGKCLLNWTLVLLQRSCVCECFIGVFIVSLTAMDTVLTLTLTALHVQGDCRLLGLRLTRHHVCLLVQILGEIYNSLQWPVVFTACLDHYLTVTNRLQDITIRARKITYSFVTGLLWTMAALYVFLVSEFHPVLENESPSQLRKCWVFCGAQISRISATVLFLTVSCALISRTGFPKLSRSLRLPRNQSRTQLTQMEHSDSRTAAGEIVAQALQMFLDTWSYFLVFVAISLMLPVGIPSHLGLNVPWLCFLNSVLIGVVLCASRPASQLLVQGTVEVPPDIFCDWRFSSVEDRLMTQPVVLEEFPGGPQLK